MCPGAFIGTCDAAIARWIGQRLEVRKENPDFMYWVTLNSHLPVPTPSPLRTPVPCSITPFTSQQPALCSWYQLIANVHQAVSALAMTDLARPTVFVIVGDHAPPFANLALRSQFSSSVVPYVLLIPRPETQISAPSRVAIIHKRATN
jgi:phosphoglycerol transferase MdoB-like AlkP superfamily enzyme